MGVNWGRAGKDARGPKCIPVRNSNVVSPHLLPPFQRDQGEYVHTAQISPERGATLGAPAPSPAFPSRAM